MGVLQAPAYSGQHSPFTKPLKFKRVQVLNLVHDSNQKADMMCSCKLQERCGYFCQHILTVTNDLTPEMICLRWHESYAFLFGVPGQEEITQPMRYFIDHIEPPSIPVSTDVEPETYPFLTS